ncbi:MAG: DUF4476 domain-containing protein [Chitinophagales bacterium]
MKKYLINIPTALLFLLSFSQVTFGQTASIHFTFPEDAGENRPPFEVWLNDVQQSAKNAKAVIVTDIPTPVCRLQLILSDNGNAEKILQNIYLHENTIYTYHIAKNKFDNYGVFYDKESPITTNPKGIVEIAYKTVSDASTASVPAAPKSGRLTFFSVPDLSPTPLCTTPLKDAEIVNLKSSLVKEEFENRKLQAAKQLISGKCLQFKQLKELMTLFEFEKSKLDLAKFGYHYVQDIDNYKVVQETFEFSESNNDWQEYIVFLKQYR